MTISGDGTFVIGGAVSTPVSGKVIRLTIPAELKRAGMEMKFVLAGVDSGDPPDASLVRLLARAHSLALRLAEKSWIELWKTPERSKAWAHPMRRD